jgi:glycosyltransferase involved in cell wall biosynthesis
MTILYVDQTGQLGGGELSLLDWLTVSPEGARVVLFEEGPFRERLEELGIPVEVLPLPSLKGIRRESNLVQILLLLPALEGLRKRLAKAAINADVLYANSQKAFLLAAIAKRPRQALIWHLRDILSTEHFHPILCKIAVAAGNRFASTIIVNSQATADAFVAAGGKAEKVRVIPDGVSAKPFDDVKSDAAVRLRRAISPNAKFMIGVFGRLAEWKGQHVLLEAVALIPGIHLCIIGDALFGEQAYAERLRDRAASPDLNGRVHFLGFRRDIPDLMTCMDVIVHSSIAAEPLGRVIIEGMLARKPVIATRAGGAIEIVNDRQTGLLVTPGSVTELCRAIELLYRDSKTSGQLASAGRHRAVSAFSLSIMSDRVNQVLNELPSLG